MSQDPSEEVESGLYAGIPWKIIKKGSLFFIALPAAVVGELLAKGASLAGLSRLSEKPDGDSMIEKVLNSLKE
jgi:hypothetical protein